MKEKISIAFFTRTPWNEMPRIRHQLANLLTAHGHHVTFFEKADSTSSSPQIISKELTVVALPEVLHHQLRPLRSIGDAANIFPRNFISKYYSDLTSPDIIVNFNYDFSFLREIFLDIPLITFINDDFIAQAKPWMKKIISERLAETCIVSDAVLTVSYPLFRQASKYNSNSHLFLPWAEKKYSQPTAGKERNSVLYFGYINHRVDFKVLEKIADATILLRLIGPVQRTVDHAALEKLLLHKNVSLLPPQLLSEIDLSDVCCSIMSYDVKVESVNACSISNRAFNLLSYGIPLLQPAFPEVVPASEKIIRYCTSSKDYLTGIEYFKNNFFDSQNEIQKFLTGNYSDNRYDFIRRIFNELTTKQNSGE
ncbi:MAG TPA: hypothetical protein VI757_11090, partial [Bacteroidia bacterium]|nr:hypothetical protein [Bacteroidia bacterium]